MTRADPMAALERARVMHRAGDDLAAEALLLESLEELAGSMEAMILLAAVEQALTRPERELRALERALMAGADHRYWKRVGSLRAQLGDWAAGASAFQRAAEAGGDDAAAWEGLARARFAEADLDGARSVARSLAERFPERAFTHLFLGHLDKVSGDRSAAETHYRRALDIDRRSGEALFALADLGCADAELRRNARRLADDDRTDGVQRINAAFAAARLLDTDGNFEDAVRYFRLANDLARDDLATRGIRYQPGAVEAEVSETLRCYGAESFTAVLEPLPIELRPIFVMGLPRSGTTLVEQILAAHPRVQAGGELTAGPICERWFRERRHAEGREGPVGEADAGLLAEARERYVDALFERDLDAELVVDKLPGNFRIAGFLRLLFPEAPMIHTVRDPRATCWSLYSANFGGHEPYYHDLHHLAHYHGQYVRLMQHWRAVLPDPPADVRYEALVREPRAGIQALLELVGLEPHPDCFRFHQHQRPIFTASHAQVRQPVYTHAVDHWRHYQRWLGPLAELASD